MILITENKLHSWVVSNSREAEGLIVELVWRLVAASCPKPLERRFPLGDSIGQQGPDGILNVISGCNPYIPDGHSHWEIGTGKGARAKATSDYKGLTTDLNTAVPEAVRANSSFVFVTPLSGRNDWKYTWKREDQASWIKMRRDKNEWKDIRVIDGTRLTEWVYQFPAVGIWLASRMYELSEHDFDIPELRWELLSSYGGDHPLTPEVFLAGRDAPRDKLQEFLANRSQHLNLKTRHPNEAIDFVCAHLASLDDEVRVDIAGRALIVSSLKAWDTLCKYTEKLILVADPSLDLSGDKGSRAIQSARLAGHVLITSDSASPPNQADVQLPSPKVHELQEKLKTAGYPSQRAEILARRSNGNLSSMLRLLQGGSSRPEWANGPDTHCLAMAVLLGSWSENSMSDRAVVGEVVGTEYSKWVAVAREFAQTPEVPIVYHQGDWRFTLRYEGWLNLGGYLYDEHLDRILMVAVSVLSEKDPQFDISSDNRYVAQIWGKVLSHSHALRKGIAEALALIGSHPEVLGSCLTGKPESTVRDAVRQILHGADWVRWASLGNLLSSLAEASPDAFLDAVENGLQQNPSPFEELFQQESPGLFGRSYLSGLLWALEGLAWDSQYLSRVCAVLGELAERDPGGNWGNRPVESLKTILLPWLPQTTAPAAKRRAAIQILKQNNPEIAWDLLLSFMPNQTESSTPTNRPFWRDTIPETWDDSVTVGEYWDQVCDYVDMIVGMLKDEPTRTAHIVELLDDLPPSAFEKALTHLSSDAVVNLPEEQRNDLWMKLVILARRHRAFPDAGWVLSDESISKIECAALRLAPKNPSSLHRMLFGEYDLHLYEYTGDWKKVDEERTVRRRTAVEEILSRGGLEEVILFVGEVEDPSGVGLTLADLADHSIDASLLPYKLEDEDEKIAQFIKSYVCGRRHKEGWGWADGLDVSNWTSSQTGRFLGCLPFTVDTWERVESLLGPAEDEYWSTAVANPYDPGCDIDLAIEKLLSHGRPKAALMCLRKQVFDKKTLNSKHALDALIEWPSSLQESVQIDAYTIARIIDALQDSPGIDRNRLMDAEWVNLALLDDHRIGSPKTLETGMATDPDLFCEITDIAYPLEEIEPSLEEDSLMIQAQRRNARRLLHNWKIPPGTQLDGTFNPKKFREWLRDIEARHDAGEVRDLVLQNIGQTLVHAPPDPAGLWIHHEVAIALDNVSADIMLEAFRIGMINKRGARFIDLTGTQEEKLSESFTQKAEDVEDQGYVRFAVALRRLADGYRLEAEQIRDGAKRMDES